MIRGVGPERVLFGSDTTLPAVTPAAAWIALHKLLPLTAEEFRVIAANVPPYLQ
jgi:predicted TIM-barrel fold metal-dependent hydrolase